MSFACFWLRGRQQNLSLILFHPPFSQYFLANTGYLLTHYCTTKARPPSTPAPQSEGLWERCLPVVSLSTRGFSRSNCFNKLKYSYQELNTWKPKFPGVNRQLSLRRADLLSLTHFSLLTPQHLKAKPQSPNLEMHLIPAQEENRASISGLPEPGILLPMGSPTQSTCPTQPFTPCSQGAVLAAINTCKHLKACTPAE